MSRGRRTVVDEAAFARDWEHGLTLGELAALYEMASSTVPQVARRMGLAKRPRGQQTNAVDRSPMVLERGQWVPDGRGVAHWQASA